VKVLNGMGVRNNNTGTINISGGLVTATHGRAVRNESSGAVNISGGTVSSDTWVAVVNYANGKITASDNAFISSAMVNNNEFGTIYQFNTGDDTDCRIEITGGTIENTSNGVAVYNNSAGATNISGGKILAKEGSAVTKTGTGELDISGGIVFSYGTTDEDVIFGDYTQSGNAVIVAWNEAAGTTTYDAGTSDDIYKLPATATAVWAKQSGNGGISVVNEGNTGFIPLPVTVESVGIAEISMEKIAVYPNPTSGQLRIKNEELREGSVIEIFNIVGQNVGAYPCGRPETTIDISHLANGMYYLKADGKTVRFIKE